MRNDTRSHGLTLLEVLVVLSIVAIGWFTLLPSLDMNVTSATFDTELDDANQLLLQARTRAMSTCTIQEVRLKAASSRIAWGDREADLPSMVSNIHVNGERHPARRNFAFRIYPSGSMDEVEIDLSNGDELQGDVLNVSLYQESGP